MALNPAIRDVMARINKKSGAGTVVLGSEIEVPPRQTITTGSLNVDAALGGGWATDHWNEIVGQPSAGKTAVVLKTIAANQKLDKDWLAVWFAAEDFHEPYARMLGVDLDRVLVVEDNRMEDVYEDCIKFIGTREIDAIVIDSLPALTPVREIEKTMEDFQPGLAAFLTGKFLRMSNPDMKRPLIGEVRPITGLIVNQWRQKIGGYGDPRTTPGGVAKDFYYFQRVEVKRDEWITNTRGQRVGQTIKVMNIKNKLSPPGREGFIDYYFARANGHEKGSFDMTKDVVSAAVAYGVIGSARGGKYTYGELSWQGRPRLDASIKADAKLRGSIKRAVLKAVEFPLPEPKEEASQPRKSTTTRKRASTRG